MGNVGQDDPRKDATVSRVEPHPVAVSAFSLLTWAGLLTLPFLILDNLHKASSPSALSLPQQVNPNQADMALLACLPGLGPYRVRAIIRYRKEHGYSDPYEPVFRRPEDLIAVKGIGPGTVKGLIPYLCFH